MKDTQKMIAKELAKNGSVDIQIGLLKRVNNVTGKGLKTKRTVFKAHPKFNEEIAKHEEKETPVGKDSKK